MKQLLERRFDEVELLIIYIDGMHFGDQCVLAAVGVDIQGCKHVLALREGATENAEAAKDLLQHLVDHGVDPTRRRLFIIDGSKALRTAINAVFGAETPVQAVLLACHSVRFCKHMICPVSLRSPVVLQVSEVNESSKRRRRSPER